MRYIDSDCYELVLATHRILKVVEEFNFTLRALVGKVMVNDEGFTATTASFWGLCRRYQWQYRQRKC
jgi:hypothetical protein